MPKNTEKNTKRRGNPQNLLKPWKPGQSGNPKGRKLGTRNRKTVIMEAIRKMAEAKGIDPAEAEELIQASGIEKAMKGSFFHYQEISNGLYGKITDKMDLTSGGKTLADLIASANAQPARTKKAQKTARKVSKRT